MADPFVVRFEPPICSTQDGPLSGLSLAVKDIFDVAGYPTLNGLKDWADQAPKAAHAPLVARLLDLGMTLIGKVVSEQLAHSTIGINPDYGIVPNARDPLRVPGGSSSGSGSAVALGLCHVSLGSDTGGSVRIPAAYQGLWGMRPSFNSLPIAGAMALAPSFDTPGFLTRDLATLTRVHQALTPGDASPLALALPQEVWDHYGRPVPLPAPLPAPLETLRDGSLPISKVDLPWDGAMAGRLSTAFRMAQAMEVTAQLGHLAEDESLNLHPGIRARLTWNKSVTQDQCAEAFAAIEGDLACLRALLDGKTALIWPTIAEPAPYITAADTLGEAHRARQFELTSPAGLLGAPQLHCPLGGLGFSLIGAQGADLDLLATAARL